LSISDTLRLLFLAALWGGSFLLMRTSVGEFGPFALIELRITFAALFLLPLFQWRHPLGDLWAHKRALCILGIFNSALPFTLIAYSTLYLTAGFASILNATMPLFTALIAYWWINDSLSSAKLLGMLIGLVGVIILVWDKVSFLATPNELIAIAAGLGAACSYGIAVTYTKAKLSHIKPWTLATGSQVASSILLLPLALLFWPVHMPSASSWLGVAVLGIMCTGIAYVIFFGLIERIGPAKSSTITFLVPGFSVVWGAYFLSEVVTLSLVVACIFILTGTAIATGILTTSNLVALYQKSGLQKSTPQKQKNNLP